METLKDAPLLVTVNTHDRKELCGQGEVSSPRRETVLGHQARPSASSKMHKVGHRKERCGNRRENSRRRSQGQGTVKAMVSPLKWLEGISSVDNFCLAH